MSTRTHLEDEPDILVYNEGENLNNHLKSTMVKHEILANIVGFNVSNK